jgi:hypothetical protein
MKTPDRKIFKQYQCVENARAKQRNWLPRLTPSPFETFTEWSGEADEKAYSQLSAYPPKRDRRAKPGDDGRSK